MLSPHFPEVGGSSSASAVPGSKVSVMQKANNAAKKRFLMAAAELFLFTW